jgi:hypothetical protein
MRIVRAMTHGGRFFSPRPARDVTSHPTSNEHDGTCPVVNNSNPSNGSLTTRSPGHGTDTGLRESLNRMVGNPQGIVGGTGQNPDHSSAKANDRRPDTIGGLVKINNNSEVHRTP